MPFDPTKRAISFIEEFRNFLFKGNLVDMAVGIIIGAAFGNIVNSLVKNIIMPLVGAMTTGGKGEVGDFFNFLILGLVIYIVVVKFVGAMLKSKQQTPPEPPADVKLLAEIRDLL